MSLCLRQSLRAHKNALTSSLKASTRACKCDRVRDRRRQPEAFRFFFSFFRVLDTHVYTRKTLTSVCGCQRMTVGGRKRKYGHPTGKVSRQMRGNKRIDFRFVVMEKLRFKEYYQNQTDSTPYARNFKGEKD